MQESRLMAKPKTKITIKDVEDSEFLAAGGGINTKSTKAQQNRDVDMNIEGITKSKFKTSAGDIFEQPDAWKTHLATLQEEVVSQLSGKVQEEMSASLAKVETLLNEK